MEVLDTIRETVGVEVDKRMEQWTQRLGKEPEERPPRHDVTREISLA